MTSKQFKVGDKVEFAYAGEFEKYKDCNDSDWHAFGAVIAFEEQRTTSWPKVQWDSDGSVSVPLPDNLRVLATDQVEQNNTEADQEPQGQEVTLSFKGDGLKVNLKATNPEGYYCNEDDLLLATQKIMQIAKNWNTFSLTISAEDKDIY